MSIETIKSEIDSLHERLDRETVTYLLAIKLRYEYDKVKKLWLTRKTTAEKIASLTMEHDILLEKEMEVLRGEI